MNKKSCKHCLLMDSALNSKGPSTKFNIEIGNYSWEKKWNIFPCHNDLKMWFCCFCTTPLPQIQLKEYEVCHFEWSPFNLQLIPLAQGVLTQLKNLGAHRESHKYWGNCRVVTELIDMVGKVRLWDRQPILSLLILALVAGSNWMSWFFLPG